MQVLRLIYYITSIRLTNQNLPTDYWKTKVQEYSAFLEEDKQFGTDEHKRLGKPRTAEDMFGAEGSFRKLEVD